MPSVVFLSASRGVWGAEESLLTLASALRARGCGVELVCYEGPLSKAWGDRVGCDAVTIGEAPTKVRRIRENLQIWRRAVRVGSRRDRFVVFTYYLTFAAPVLRIARRHVYLDMHDYIGGRRGRFLLRSLSRGCRGVVAVSQFVADQFEGRSVAVLTRPVTPVATGPRSGPASGINVGLIGRVVPEKGHDLLVRAIESTAPDSKTRVIFRGDVTVDREFATRAESDARRRLGDRVRFEGQVPREQVLRDLDVLVVANSAEPMGRTVLEAQLARVVVVVPSTGGSAELVNDGVTGFVYQAEDVTSLANAMGRATSHEGRALLDYAQETARSVTDPTSYAASYLAVLGMREDGDAC